MKVVKEKKQQIQRQINFYFSDSNLPFDKFLKEQCSAEGGWVDLSVVIAFARVQALLGTEWKTPDAVPDDCIQAVATVLRSDVENVEISEDGYQIRRKDMPDAWDEVIAAVGARSVHIACLPHSATMEALARCMNEHGTVNSVRLLKRDHPRMGEERVFRGCAMVEMSSPEEAKELIAKEVQYDGSTVRFQSKADYEALLRDRTVKRPFHDIPSDVQLPPVKADDLPPDPGAADQEDEDMGAVNGAGKPGGKDPARQEEFTLSDNMKDRLLRFNVVGEPEDVPKGKGLRDAFGGEDSGVVFVSQEREDVSTGVVKFSDKQHCTKMLEGCDEEGCMKLTGGQQVKLSKVTGDDEVKWWKADIALLNAKASQRGGDKRGEKRSFRGGGRGHGGRGRGRGKRGWH